MKTAVVQAHGAPDAVVRVVDDFPRPTLGRCSSMMVVRVLAGSLNAGDDIVLSGRARGLMPAIKNFPYALGGDICGEVVETNGVCRRFNVGDLVMAQLEFDDKFGIGEYALVSPKRAARIPHGLSAIEAASLPTVGLTALEALQLCKVQEGQRVLVLGGSTGVGLMVVQLLKDSGASFVAATSQNEELVASLGADLVINYTQVDWWTQVSEIDVVIDAVGDPNAMAHCMDVLASRAGRLVSVNPFGIDMDIASKWDAFHAVWGFAMTGCRQRWSRSFKMSVVNFKVNERRMDDLCQAVESGRLRPILDERSPFPFDEASVVEAANILHAHAGKGKLVIQVAEEAEDQEADLEIQLAKTSATVVPVAKLLDEEEPQAK